jgi:hypothetical protein
MVPGYSYIYVASITEENLNPGNDTNDTIKPITFDVEKVEGWDTTTDKAFHTAE